MSLRITDWPENDRPREKLLRRGEQALSDSELLAILLRIGCSGVSAIDLARRILAKFGTFRNMSHTDSRDWDSIKGMGPSKVAQVRAALEIGRRCGLEPAAPRAKVSGVKDIVAAIMPLMRDLKTEVFKVVYLDGSNKIIDISDAAAGTVNYAAPIVREIIHSALQKFAVSIICAHNHPSASIEPSEEDKKFTQNLVSAGKLLGVTVLDHIIIGDNRYYSFAGAGDI
jgi:DNA repair protein RadC